MANPSPGSAAWGYKYYGDPDAPGYVTKNIVSILFCGRRVTVNRKCARVFLRLARIFEAHAPKYARQIDDFMDDWGFNNRYISGTNVKSNHSFGTAIDIDATRNARNGGSFTDSAIWQGAREAILHAEKEGLIRWGGRYSNPDEMHFECILTPTQARIRYTRDGRKRLPRRSKEG